MTKYEGISENEKDNLTELLDIFKNPNNYLIPLQQELPTRKIQVRKGFSKEFVDDARIFFNPEHNTLNKYKREVKKLNEIIEHHKKMLVEEHGSGYTEYRLIWIKQYKEQRKTFCNKILEIMRKGK